MTIGWVTLDVGDQALVYNHEGVARTENGPQRMFLWRERYEVLKRNAANQNSYLVVQYKDGRVEHRKGPCVMFTNPLEHYKIEIRDMISLDANEALVIYREDSETKNVTRYVQYGPTLVMPQANEWFHSFSWHGTDPENKTQLIPNAHQFQKLQIIPGQFYYNVDEVRTKDDAPIRVKLMVFYELKDIETMLNATKDPIADIVNCVCADVVAFAAKHSYIEFMENSSELNDLANYPQLRERSKKIGYEISKMVYRGYHAHPELQRIHDTATQTRTRLKLAYEKEEQQQNMTDLKLKNDRDRLNLEQTMEIESLNHKQNMEKAAVEHRLGLRIQEEEKKRDRWTEEKMAALEAKKEDDKVFLQHIGELRKLGVDLNQYLQSEAQQPQKVIRIAAGDKAANFHLHRN
ncbi:uncharacterized protein LOC133189023 [Saccostrea echinata]|uniref:uncharacterized protein LOC133189023 n=1 Tax=Saccostrea echinata TaxID=191078 RepID=UPI002A7ED1AA|nr:uncharacterized protein LOC133189023 [Saccostrea echinata]